MRLVEVNHVVELIAARGLEAVLVELAERIEADYRRWTDFDKSPRYAAHSPDGVIELMPIADAEHFGCKYVNGHPANQAKGLQTVTGFGIWADVATGYPLMIAEMTLVTALRTAAMSALAARHLARSNPRRMALVGLGAQSEFQAVAFKAILGVREIQAYDVDDAAARKFAANMEGSGIRVRVVQSAGEAIEGADIVTTVTADKKLATVLSDNMVGAGIHINAVGGDCPGKTELQAAILDRSRVFVEYEPQTRVEGEIQQMPADFPVVELWRVIAGEAEGRRTPDEITLFDSVGFAIEDFSALGYLYDATAELGLHREIDLLARPTDPRDLYGMIARREAEPVRPKMTLVAG